MRGRRLHIAETREQFLYRTLQSITTGIREVAMKTPEPTDREWVVAVNLTYKIAADALEEVGRLG